MKKLNDLFDCNYDIEIKGIKINSKEIKPGDLFVCIEGVKIDRHDYIEDAVNNGAVAVVVSKKVKCSVPSIMVENTNNELPKICSDFYNNPEKKLKLIGVTGTDGKTTTTTIIQTLLGDSICGYIGTNGRKCSKFDRDTNNTTPDSDKLYQYFNEFLESGCNTVAMETSSEAFFRNRLSHIEFNIGAITNITPEHLNVHKTYENYVDCKCQLFRQIKDNGYAILNHDDKEYDSIRSSCKCKVLTYGKDEENDLQIKDIKLSPFKTFITYIYNKKIYNIESPLLGEFNVYNLACALLCCIAYGKNIEEALQNLNKVKVSGRLELLPNIGQKFSVMIDYAHTPNGISNLLKFVNTLDIKRSIVVIGSAGERDYLKRPIMGKTIVDNASYAIFTYEDPRSEEISDIIEMMIKDIKNYNNYEIVLDRSMAIKRAIDMAEENDIILILGKGNETYEKLKNKVIYFNDFEEAKKHLSNRLETERITQ